MANFDPTQRVETWLFQQISTHPISGQPVYKRLKYNWVSYDGVPERYLEPVNPEPFWNGIGNTNAVINPRFDFGQFVGIEFVTGRLSEAFAMDDIDALAASNFV